MKKRRMAVGVLTAVAAVLLGNTMVMAEAKAGEPVLSIETDRTEIETDRTEYSSTDPIMETVKVYNTSDDMMTDIVIKGNIPEGYQTEDGISSAEQWKIQIEKVDVGEISESTVNLVSESSETGQGYDDTEKTGNVQTGNTENIILWCTIGTVSLCIIIATVKKRKGKTLLSLLLVVAMAGTLLPASLTVRAEEPDDKVSEMRTEEAVIKFQK